MLVVLLILLVATASAAVSVSNTQTELQSAGNERVAMQTRYLAETAITSSLAWVDRIQERFNNVLQPAAGTELAHYAEPELPVGKLLGMATIDNVALEQRNGEAPPLADAVPHTSAGSGGSGGMAGSAVAGAAGAPPPDPPDPPAGITDHTGSFGPEQGYGLTSKAFLVHFTDCVKAPGALAPGEDLRDGASGPIAFHCVVTARGRLEPSGGSTESSWSGSGGKSYTQRVFSSAHDARATIVSPLTMPP